MTRRTIAGLLASAVLALATASAHAAEGGMPQLNFRDFPPQLVWLLITFAVLFFVMTKIALPRVGEVLQMRADRIRDDLERATSLKAETDTVIAAYEKALTDARNQAATVGRDTAAALAKTAAERQNKVAGELATRIKAAETNIGDAKARAMGEIRTVAADIATDAARRLVGLQVSSADAQAAVATALKERG